MFAGNRRQASRPSRHLLECLDVLIPDYPTLVGGIPAVGRLHKGIITGISVLSEHLDIVHSRLIDEGLHDAPGEILTSNGDVKVQLSASLRRKPMGIGHLSGKKLKSILNGLLACHDQTREPTEQDCVISDLREERSGS
jgi:hypothetical protein